MNNPIQNLSRRGFLQGAAGLTLGLSLPAFAAKAGAAAAQAGSSGGIRVSQQGLYRLLFRRTAVAPPVQAAVVQPLQMGGRHAPGFAHGHLAAGHGHHREVIEPREPGPVCQ